MRASVVWWMWHVLTSQVCGACGTTAQKWSTWQKSVRVKKVGQMNKCNQQESAQKAVVKINGDEKPKGVLLKKQEIFKLVARKFHFPEIETF